MAEVVAPTADLPAWQRRYPALSYPNFRLWFVGQMVASFGMWVQMTAQGYLIFDLTQSPAFLGYVSFASGIPTWLLTLYGGLVADRVPRRSLLLATQSCMMVLGLTLAALTLSGHVQPWHILVLALVGGIVNAFDAPARQSFLLEMVERQDLTNAIALSSMMFNLATAVGPAVAGFIYALVGPGWCFLINGLSFIAMLAALLAMHLKPTSGPVMRRASAISDLGEGMRYAVGHPVIRLMLMVIAVTSLFGMAFATLIPAWAVRILGGDATTNGLMQSARGLGALVGAITIASMGRFNYKGRVLSVALLIMPVTVLIFSQIRWLPLALVALVGTGVAFIPIVNLANALVQTHVPDELRGRVMGIYTLVFFGMWPLGGLWAGTMAQALGETAPVMLGAGITLVFAVAVWAFFPKLRELE